MQHQYLAFFDCVFQAFGRVFGDEQLSIASQEYSEETLLMNEQVFYQPQVRKAQKFIALLQTLDLL